MTTEERFFEILHLVDAAARLIHRHEATDARPVLLLLRAATEEARFGAEFAAQQHERRRGWEGLASEGNEWAP